MRKPGTLPTIGRPGHRQDGSYLVEELVTVVDPLRGPVEESARRTTEDTRRSAYSGVRRDWAGRRLVGMIVKQALHGVKDAKTSLFDRLRKPKPNPVADAIRDYLNGDRSTIEFSARTASPVEAFGDMALRTLVRFGRTDSEGRSSGKPVIELKISRLGISGEQEEVIYTSEWPTPGDYGSAKSVLTSPQGTLQPLGVADGRSNDPGGHTGPLYAEEIPTVRANNEAADFLDQVACAGFDEVSVNGVPVPQRNGGYPGPLEYLPSL